MSDQSNKGILDLEVSE